MPIYSQVRCFYCVNEMMKSTVWCRTASTNRGTDREREGGEERDGVKEKRMWPTVKDDWRGVELSV